MFQLCLQGVGGHLSAHPDYLEKVLNRRQIVEWLAEFNLRPFGDERADLRQAVSDYWTISAQLTEIPDDHSPEKYKLKFNDGPPPTEAQGIMQQIREIL